jgi:hypothetical protein
VSVKMHIDKMREIAYNEVVQTSQRRFVFSATTHNSILWAKRPSQEITTRLSGQQVASS